MQAACGDWIHLATQLVASHHMAVGWLYDWAVGQKGCVDSCSPWECVLSLRFQHLTLIDLHQLEGWWLWTAHKIQYDATPSLNFKIRMNCKCASCLQPGSEKHGVSASNLKSKSTWSLSRRILLHFRFTRLGFLHLLAILQNWWKRMLHVCTVFARISQSFLSSIPRHMLLWKLQCIFRGQIPRSCDNGSHGVGHLRGSWSEASVATKNVARLVGENRLAGRQLVGRSYLFRIIR